MKIFTVTVLLLFNISDTLSQVDLNYSTLRIEPITNTEKIVFGELDTLISGKRIILLGEQHHFSNEINIMKSTLIKYLHTKHGYSVILWESNIGSLFIGNKILAQASSDSILRSTLYNFWRVKSNYELFQYIKENDLKIGGFDMQGKSVLFANWMYLKLVSIDTNLAQIFLMLDSRLLAANYSFAMKWTKRIFREKFILRNRDLYINIYSSIIEIVKTDSFNLTNLEKAELLQCLNVRLRLVDYLSLVPLYNAYAYREQVMFENLLFYLNEVYPNEKVIIWAANVHTRKTGYSYFKNQPSMTNYLINCLKSDEYISIAINSTAYSEKPLMLANYSYKKFAKYISKQKYDAAIVTLREPKNLRKLNSNNMFSMFDALILLNRISKFD
jgi:erythromycin esterase